MRDIKNIAENVHFVRKYELYMSQEELAELLNISRDTVSNIERGQTIPKPETLLKLAIISEKTIDYFFKKRRYAKNTYHIVEEQLYLNSGWTTVYGVETEGLFIPNVFTDRSTSEDFIQRCNTANLHPCHLLDVIYDTIG